MALRRIKERKERRKKVVMSLVISFLMVASAFGVYLGSQQDNIRDYGISFTIDYEAQVYRARIDGQRLSFYYLPSSVSTIPVDQDAIPLIRESLATIVTFDPGLDEFNLQVADLLRFDLAETLNKPLINAVAKPSPLYPSLPVMTCDNATTQMPVISIEADAQPRIFREDNCVRILANATGMLEIRDRFLYEYLGVFDT